MLYVFIFFFRISLADDNAPSKQLVSSEEESKALPAAEDVSGATAASSSTPEYVFLLLSKRILFTQHQKTVFLYLRCEQLSL